VGEQQKGRQQILGVGGLLELLVFCVDFVLKVLLTSPQFLCVRVP
jgi:hypothetical protein